MPREYRDEVKENTETLNNRYSATGGFDSFLPSKKAITIDNLGEAGNFWKVIQKGRPLVNGLTTLFDINLSNNPFDIYRIKSRLESGAAATTFGLRFNNDTSANYYYEIVESGAITTAAAQTSITLNATTLTDVDRMMIDISIQEVFNTGNHMICSWVSSIFLEDVRPKVAHGAGALVDQNGVYSSINNISLITSAGTISRGSRYMLEGFK